MATHPAPRVIRVYALPVEQFDHLKELQRRLQVAADAEAGKPAQPGDAHWIDNSRALAHLVQTHALYSMAAARFDMAVNEMAVGLYLSDFNVVPAQGVPA